jgi:undecaprenyl-diphosphatase
LTVLQAAILGLLQGFTEFLPVSSSGHLVLAQHLLRVENPEILSFDVYAHVGTLISIFVVYWKDLREMVAAFGAALTSFELRKSWREREPFRLGVALLIGSIPASIIGLMFHDQIKEAFADPKLVSMNMVITGFLLFLTQLTKTVEGKKVGIASAIVIGIAQAAAILPGISRSGSTISTGMYLKISALQSARFSFLLAIPVILGAAFVEGSRFVSQGIDVGVLPLFVGTVMSAISGFVAIEILLKIVSRGKFSLFAFYCLIVGTLGIIFI